MTSSHASRQRSRSAALQVLFAVDMRMAPQAEGDESQAPEELLTKRSALCAEAFADAVAHTEIPKAAMPFARELASGVCAELDAIDETIGRFARNWRVARMATVDRNVLRLAVYELMKGEVPAPVIIDQAVELARRFGGEHSPSFVNGVLDAIARAGLSSESRSPAPSLSEIS